jgi:hypothetical protein
MMKWVKSLVVTAIMFMALAAGTMALDRVEKSAKTEATATDSGQTDDSPPAVVVEIEAPNNVLQGQRCAVDVTIRGFFGTVESFDLLFAYEPSAMVFIGASLSDTAHQDPNRFAFDTLSSFGPDGTRHALIRLRCSQKADSSPQPSLAQDVALFEVRFLVSDDRTLECHKSPIRFFWRGCEDNRIIVSHRGESGLVITPSSIRDYPPLTYPTWYGRHGKSDYEFIEKSPIGFPTFAGPQDECGEATGVERTIAADFHNGGVAFVCHECVDASGDINLNNQSYEVADLALFAELLLVGDSVLNINRAGQIASTDVNKDGIVMGVDDYLYLTRVIVGDAGPYSKLQPDTTTVTQEHGILAVSDLVGAAFVIVGDSVVPELLAEHMDMQYHFDGLRTNILISSLEVGAVFIGPFLRVDGPITQIEMATYDGAPVTIEGSFRIPFDEGMDIGFSLQKSAEVQLSIWDFDAEHVITLINETMPPGPHRVTWDGTDSNGNDVDSGTYFYRLKIDDQYNTRKIVLME